MATNPEQSNGHNPSTPLTPSPNKTNTTNTTSTTTPSPNIPTNTPNDDQLMTHIIDHLRFKGLDTVANTLQSSTNTSAQNTPNNKNGHNTNSKKRSFSQMNTSYLSQLYTNSNTHSNNDTLITDEQVMSTSDFSLQSFGEYSQLFVHNNKSQISYITFSDNGLYTGIGCHNGNIRIFDVNKMHQSRNFNSLIKKYDSNSYSDIHRPLLTTLNCGFINYDNKYVNTHNQYTVNEVSFFPDLNRARQLCCAYMGGVHFYEFEKQNRKSPTHTIKESFNVYTVQYHPSGNYIIAAGDACYIRLYDIKKEQGYIACKNERKDYGINQIRYCANGGGNIFVACTESGDIRLYDGRSMCVVNTLKGWHNQCAVTSVRFSKNCKYLLSNGKDNIARLCDLRMGKQCQNYKNNRMKMGNRKRVNGSDVCYSNQACFTYNDEHVLCYNETSNRICVYDTNTGQRISKFKDHCSGSSHSSENGIVYLATSPTEPAFMCASSGDKKNRFYATIKQMVNVNRDNNTQNVMSDTK